MLHQLNLETMKKIVMSMVLIMVMMSTASIAQSSRNPVYVDLVKPDQTTIKVKLDKMPQHNMFIRLDHTGYVKLDLAFDSKNYGVYDLVNSDETGVYAVIRKESKGEEVKFDYAKIDDKTIPILAAKD